MQIQFKKKVFDDMVNTANSAKSRQFNEVKHFLPNATDEQIERLIILVERLRLIQDYLSQNPEDFARYQEMLLRAQKALNYKRPYRIAVIGKSGVGKSTLINAILARDLVLMKELGNAATGAALEIFLKDAPNGKKDCVQVVYRDESNIRRLVEDFVKDYQLDYSQFNGKLDAGFSTVLLSCKPSYELSEQARKEFTELRQALADIVVQYANNIGQNLRNEFSLTNSRDVQELKELIDENSQLNGENSTNRRIGLVKSVTYYIQPDNQTDGVPALQLPGNVCLVDLPGIAGAALHDIIIREGIKEADAVIFIFHPRRIVGSNEKDLLNRVKKYISLEGSVQSGERIFLVLNAKDEIKCNHNSPEFDELRKIMYGLMDDLVPGYATNFNNNGGKNPYFLISAQGAYYAQKQLKGEPIETKYYDGIKLALDVMNGSDLDVLQVSQVPHLVDEINKFARDRLIEGQIRDGNLAIESIINPLFSEYENELSQLTRNQGKFYLQDQEEQILHEKRQSLENLVIEFRRSQLERFEDSRKQLEKEAINICDRTDQVLKEKMPQLWKEAFHAKWDRLNPQQIGKPIFEFILSETQIALWEQLTLNVPILAKQLVGIYTSNLETYKVSQKISNGCYGYVEVGEVNSIIKQLIDTNMRHTMTEIGGRIALTRITDPTCGFTVLTPDSKQEKKTTL